MKYVLDTHIWMWWNASPEKLSESVRALLEDSGRYSELLLSAISPWEFFKLIEKNRYRISTHPEAWVKEALKMTKLRLVPLSPSVSYQATTLPGEFHSDPADQIIVATARHENAIVLTKDRLIQNYPHVKSFW